ncbi:MAG: FecR family protein [Leptospiraceae bacterium]|nr:FecR family protein [Leptospiraceae bacterium]MDW8307157.1 FecR family protein [Leptospiraceae bacterium]
MLYLLKLGLLVWLIVGCKKEKAAKLEERFGVVTFTSGNENYVERGPDRLIAKAGTLVKNQDRVKTGIKSRMDIQLQEGVALSLKEESEISIEDLSELMQGETQDKLYLSRGAIFVKIIKLNQGSQFQVRTPTLVASVRGTAFYLKSSKKSSSLAVTEGRVEITTSQGEKKEISQGEKANVAEGKPLEVGKILDKEYREISLLSQTRFFSSEEFAGLKQKLREFEKFSPLEGKQEAIETLKPKIPDPGLEKIKSLRESKESLDAQKQELQDSVKLEQKQKELEEKIPETKELPKEAEKGKEMLENLKKKKMF